MTSHLLYLAHLVCGKPDSHERHVPASPQISTSDAQGAACKDAPTNWRAEAIALAQQREAEHMAEFQAHEALWWRDGCFSHKGAADRALAMAQEARRLRGLLEAKGDQS